MKRWLKRLAYLFAAMLFFAVSGTWYVHAHPLVFNESFWSHAHCITGAGLALHEYAVGHQGQFPNSPHGYADALLSLDEIHFSSLTGPEYSDAPMIAAKRSGQPLKDSACGRVYIPGLNLKSSSELVLLYDKIPTPGGDHCHGLERLVAPLGREVLFTDGQHQFIPETEWPAFVITQRTLLTNAGFDQKKLNYFYKQADEENSY